MKRKDGAIFTGIELISSGYRFLKAKLRLEFVSFLTAWQGSSGRIVLS